MSTIRDRVRELRRVRAGDLLPHARNWRKHPEPQREALRGVFDEIGFAGALIARELDDGRLELIDGHLRAATLTDVEVPVLVVDLTADEAALLLAVHDPIGALAETDAAVLSDIVATVEVRQAALAAMLGDVLRAAPPQLEVPRPLRRPVALPSLEDSYQLLVECADEAEQRVLFERLTGEGRKCRVLTL